MKLRLPSLRLFHKDAGKPDMPRRTINDADSNALSFGLIIVALLILGAIIELTIAVPKASEFGHQVPREVETIAGE